MTSQKAEAVALATDIFGHMASLITANKPATAPAAASTLTSSTADEMVTLVRKVVQKSLPYLQVEVCLVDSLLASLLLD